LRTRHKADDERAESKRLMHMKRQHRHRHSDHEERDEHCAHYRQQRRYVASAAAILMAEKRSYDAGKKIVGRKRHIAVDTDGRLLAVNLTTADISDSAGAQPILDAIRKRWPWMKRLFADGAYDRRTLLDKAAFLDFVVEVVRRTDTDPGFKVIPRRWVVERSIGWLTRYRRLVRDYEQRLDVSEAMIFLAMGNLLLRRITHP